jgi:hypothetical protein
MDVLGRAAAVVVHLCFEYQAIRTLLPLARVEVQAETIATDGFLTKIHI